MPSDRPDNNDRGLTKGQFVDYGAMLMPHSPLRFAGFFDALAECLRRTEATGRWARPTDHEAGDTSDRLARALHRLQVEFRACHRRGNSVIFVGNGGSAAIASHMAVDYTKNGGIRARALNDPAMLTCFANDFGYEHVFAMQLEHYARKGDLVVIISSSGRSPNVVKTAHMANELGLDSVRLTGMDPENPLRRGGMLNLYVPVGDYGLVEITHFALLHSLVSASQPLSRKK